MKKESQKQNTPSFQKNQNLYKHLPQKGGVYLMLNSKKQVIYIGKAKNLLSRVRSYFFSTSRLKNRFLVRQIQSIDYILTQTDTEAYLLEASLVKKHKPRYNVKLKDDKAYPYICFSLKDKFPRFYLERKVKRNGNVYFGPYSRGSVVRNMIRFLNETYQIRDCSDAFMKSRKTPCLTHQMGYCKAPCVGKVSVEDYGEHVQGVLSFMKGSGVRFVQKLKKKMQQEAHKEQFEQALDLKNRIDSIEAVWEKQFVLDNRHLRDCDVLSQYSEKNSLIFEILHIRSGRLIGHLSHFDKVWIQRKNSSEEVFLSFLIQYYSQNLIPAEIIVPESWNTKAIQDLKSALRFLSSSPPSIQRPRKQSEKKWSQIAFENAQNKFKTQLQKSENIQKILLKIKKTFHLSNSPHRIECFDISHHQSKSAYASQVVFENGIPKKEDYRLYKLPEINDDYGSMKRCLERRFSEEKIKKTLPDLLLIDGGKGQLQIVSQILKENHLNIPLVAIAKPQKKEKLQKKVEKFYLPLRKNAISLPEYEDSFKLLVRIRDEAHRFAITTHRKKFRSQALESSLTQIEGMGEKRRAKLLRKFKTLQGIQKAGVQKVSQELRISLKLAQKIISSLEKIL